MSNASAPKHSLRVAIIMAGGSGERFWPLSRANRPKQLLALTHPQRSMLEQQMHMIEPLIPNENVYVVTSDNLLDSIRRERGSLPECNIIAEPMRRNTCGCLSYAAAWLLAHHDLPPEQITMAVVTADHQIGDPLAYRKTLDAALRMAERVDALGVIGIKPTRPETGYGYIEIAPEAEPLECSLLEVPSYPVARFREKPNRQMAEELIETGRCFWNSGMFFWRLSVFLEEMKHAQPDIALAVHEMTAAMRAGDETRVAEIFESIRGLPIDIALLEQARSVMVTPADFPWDDVGAWDALERTHVRDERGNVVVGRSVAIDSRDCIIYNATRDGRVDVAIVGVEGLAVVVTEDAILVVAKDKAQDVKRAVAELKQLGAHSL